MKNLLIVLCSLIAVAQTTVAQGQSRDSIDYHYPFNPRYVEPEYDVVLTIHHWGYSSTDNILVQVMGNMLIKEYYSDEDGSAAPWFGDRVSEFYTLPEFQQFKIKKYLLDILLGDLMYINRTLSKETVCIYSGKVYRLYINGVLYFESIDLPDIPCFRNLFITCSGWHNSTNRKFELSDIRLVCNRGLPGSDIIQPIAKM